MKTFYVSNKRRHPECVGVHISENLARSTYVHSLFNIWNYLCRPIIAIELEEELQKIPDCNRNMIREIIKYENFLRS